MIRKTALQINILSVFYVLQLILNSFWYIILWEKITLYIAIARSGVRIRTNCRKRLLGFA